MIILGINDGHGAGAALIIEGRLVAAVSEERLSRQKTHIGYPARAIEQCLEIASIDHRQVDKVALATRHLVPWYMLTRRDSTFSVQDYWREQHEYWYPRFYGDETPAYLDIFKDKIDRDRFVYDESLIRHEDDVEGMLEARLKVLEERIGVGRDQINVYDHQSCHAYYGYFANPNRLSEVLVYTTDGGGDGANGSVWIGKEGQPLVELGRSDICNIGRMYRYATLLLGMKMGEHEYKVMGLAPYAKEYLAQEAYEVYAETLQVDELGFRYKVRPPDNFFYFKERLEGARFDSIAYAIQRRAEELLTEWVLNGVRSTGIGNVILSGGVAQNVKANKRIWELDGVSSIYVGPGPGDESVCIGAAYQELMNHLVEIGQPLEAIPPVETAYLGKSYSDKEIRESIERAGLPSEHTVREVTPDNIAELLAEGEVVGHFSGRMEFGPRALGNRSILAHPAHPDVVKIINEIIKDRDFWMPFAPSILSERAADYLVNPKNVAAPYMAIAFDSTPLAQKEMKAALHSYDSTVRPQLVTKEASPRYHAILRAFEERTGIGAVLNTSFNVHGEPIVESPADAVSTFQRSGLQHVALGNWLISKPRRPVD